MYFSIIFHNKLSLKFYSTIFNVYLITYSPAPTKP